jgi:hypothetical protein
MEEDQAMNKVVKAGWTVLMLGVGGWVAAAAPGTDRSAGQILNELDAVKIPLYDAS